MHRFKECLQWMELLLSDNSEIKQEQKFVSSLLQPIVHFELGHEELVENYTRSAYRLLSKKERLHDFERLVIKYLKGMPLTADQKEFHQKLSEFRDGMKELTNRPRFTYPLGMEEIQLWVNYRTIGKSMAKQLAEHAAAEA